LVALVDILGRGTIKVEEFVHVAVAAGSAVVLAGYGCNAAACVDDQGLPLSIRSHEDFHEEVLEISRVAMQGSSLKVHVIQPPCPLCTSHSISLLIDSFLDVAEDILDVILCSRCSVSSSK
jgi:hypothetical protein